MVNPPDYRRLSFCSYESNTLYPDMSPPPDDHDHGDVSINPRNLLPHRGEAANYYDPEQTFSTTGSRSSTSSLSSNAASTIMQTSQAMFTQAPDEPTAIVGEVGSEDTAHTHKQAQDKIKPGLLGTTRAILDLARGKPYIKEDTKERHELLRRMDKLFTNGFIGRYGRLNKGKTGKFLQEMHRVADCLDGVASQDINWDHVADGQRRRRDHEAKWKGASTEDNAFQEVL